MCKGRENDNRFPIKTYVASLFEIENVERYIFNEDIEYSIPIYQRPYSWDEEHISNFIKTILDDYIPEESEEKAIFFGTMQYNIKNNEKDIVDGQQRMTTFLLFLSLLQSLAEGEISSFANKVNIDNAIINEFLTNQDDICERLCDVKPKKKKGYHIIEENYNQYKSNYILLYTIFKEYYDNEDNKNELIKHGISNIKEYAKVVYNHIIDNVYFVVMETEKEDMPLSEIVRVFNTINTTGMDLNAADIFKLKFFDYHRKPDATKEDDDKLLSDINDCFDYLASNSTIKMTDVLDIYKHIICSAPEDKALGFAILKMSNESFFEWLFKRPGLCNKIREYLSVEALNKLVKLVVSLNTYSCAEANSGIHSFAEQIICKTRYARYWTLPYVYAFFKLKDKNIDCFLDENKTSQKERIGIYNKALEVSYSAAKLFIIYSVVYNQVVNHVQNCTCEYMASFKTTLKDLIPEEWTLDEFKKRLKFDLKGNDTRASIVCAFSAIIDEVYSNVDYSSIRKKLFNWKENPYDIEHIFAIHIWPYTLTPNECELFNGIGNLVVLERGINRFIQDMAVEQKILYYRGFGEGKEGEKSKFISVEKVCLLFDDNNSIWDKSVIENRADSEVVKIMNILFPQDQEDLPS